MKLDTKAIRHMFDVANPEVVAMVRPLCARVDELEKALESALRLHTEQDGSLAYELYRAACDVLEGKP